MAGMDKLQPSPKLPLPEPESYESDSAGPNPPLPGVVAIGIVVEPVPVTGLAANFSPIPRMAPPPLGSETTGAPEPPTVLEPSVATELRENPIIGPANRDPSEQNDQLATLGNKRCKTCSWEILRCAALQTRQMCPLNLRLQFR